jgi:hypothetical protein
VLFAGFTPVPNAYAATVKQAGGFIFTESSALEHFNMSPAAGERAVEFDRDLKAVLD